MAVKRSLPYLACHFRVSWSGNDPPADDGGFSEVLLPPFAVGAAGAAGDPVAGGAPPVLGGAAGADAPPGIGALLGASPRATTGALPGAMTAGATAGAASGSADATSGSAGATSGSAGATSGSAGATSGSTETTSGRTGATSGRADAEAAGTRGGGDAARLILRRGFSGSLELYRWCEDARVGREGHVRTVGVDLLDGETGRVVCSWEFTRARPEQLDYTPLRALEGSVLVESLSLSFERMTVK